MTHYKKLKGFLNSAESPHVAERARGVHQKAEGKVPIIPLVAKPEGPAKPGAFKRVHT